jgi:hypothetical protein
MTVLTKESSDTIQLATKTMKQHGNRLIIDKEFDPLELTKPGRLWRSF